MNIIVFPSQNHMSNLQLLSLSGIIYDASSETMQDIDHVDGSKHTSAFGKSIGILSVAVYRNQALNHRITDSVLVIRCHITLCINRFSDRKLVNRDVVKLRLSGVVTGSTS